MSTNAPRPTTVMRGTLIRQSLMGQRVVAGSVSDAPSDSSCRVLLLLDRAARRAARGFFGWEGYTDPAVIAWLDRHAPEG